MEVTFDSFDAFSNLLQDDTSNYVTFFVLLLLAAFMLFVLFLRSLGGSRSRKVVTDGAQVSFDTKYLDRLKAVGDDTQEVIGQLNETIEEKEQEITHKYERIQQLEEKAQRLEEEIEKKQQRAKNPFNFGSLLVGLIIGIVLVLAGGGYAYVSGMIEWAGK